MNIYDLIDPSELTGIAREMIADEDRPQNQFILGQFFPNVTTDDIFFEFDKGPTRTYTDSMTYRAWTTEAPIGSRPGLVTARGEIPPLSKKYPLTELDRIRQRAQRRGQSLADAALDDILDDVASGVRAARARMERARAEIIDTGSLVLSENGLEITVDFGRAAGRESSAGTAWTDTANATALDDESGIVDTLSDEEGLDPDNVVAICNRATMRLMKANAQYTGFYPTVRELDSVPRAAIDEIREANDLPPLIVYNASAADHTGSTSLLVPEGKIWYVPRNNIVGETVWGVPAVAEEPSMNLELDERPGLVAYLLQSFDPLMVWTMVEGVGLPILKDPNATYSFDTTP